MAVQVPSTMIKWVRLSQNLFDNLESKDPSTMYLITDTQEIYNGEKKYASDIEYIESFPEQPIKGKLYIKNSTLEGKTWDGARWIVVIPRLNGALQDGVDCDGIVTGEAVKEYVTDKLNDLGGGIVSSNTDKVKISKSITVAGQSIGSYKDGDVIKEGETLTSVLTKILAKRVPPIYIRPTVSITPSSQILEAGSNVSPTINAIFTKNDAGPLASYKVIREVSGQTEVLIDKGIIEPIKIDQFQVVEEHITKFTAAVIYSKGSVKQDNLGDDDSTGQIEAGAVTSYMTYTAARKLFYGSLVNIIELNSNDIRGLRNSKLNYHSGTFDISILVGDKQIIIAYPANLPDIRSITSSSLNLNVLSTFNKTIVKVAGANGYKPIDYKVYEYKPAIPFATADTYKVLI